VFLFGCGYMYINSIKILFFTNYHFLKRLPSFFVYRLTQKNVTTLAYGDGLLLYFAPCTTWDSFSDFGNFIVFLPRAIFY